VKKLNEKNKLLDKPNKNSLDWTEMTNIFNILFWLEGLIFPIVFLIQKLNRHEISMNVSAILSKAILSERSACTAALLTGWVAHVVATEFIYIFLFPYNRAIPAYNRALPAYNRALPAYNRALLAFYALLLFSQKELS
jgi:hypothetical protein